MDDHDSIVSGDLFISGGQIQGIGAGESAEADIVIDATGLRGPSGLCTDAYSSLSDTISRRRRRPQPD